MTRTSVEYHVCLFRVTYEIIDVSPGFAVVLQQITASQLPSRLPSPLEIVHYCQNAAYTMHGTAWSSTAAPTVWIKWGIGVRMSEARTQDYVAEIVNTASDTAVRIPRVHLAFMYEGCGYIVMEYVAGATAQQLLQKPAITLEECNRIYKAVAAAVKQLVEIHVSVDTPPGPVGGGLIGHPCFHDRESDVKYDSVEALEAHFNNVRIYCLHIKSSLLASIRSSHSKSAHSVSASRTR